MSFVRYELIFLTFLTYKHCFQRSSLVIMSRQVHVRRRLLRPLLRAAVHRRYRGRVGYGGGFEGSYVAVSGRPGERTIHAVDGGRSISSEGVR